MTAALHERIVLTRPGMITRGETWWRSPAERARRDQRPVIAAVHTGPDGDDGFVAATAGKGDIAGRALQVEDLHADGAAAEAALWRFLLDVDLISEVTAWARPLDEPLDLLLADPRDLTVTGVEDELWLRLVDVPAALAARGFADAPPVLLGVHDPLLETNAGVYRIAGGTAERVEPLGGPVAPELSCDVAALAMAYLGDRRPAELAATGWWTVHDPRCARTGRRGLRHDDRAVVRHDVLTARDRRFGAKAAISGRRTHRTGDHGGSSSGRRAP